VSGCQLRNGRAAAKGVLLSFSRAAARHMVTTKLWENRIFHFFRLVAGASGPKQCRVLVPISFSSLHLGRLAAATSRKKIKNLDRLAAAASGTKKKKMLELADAASRQKCGKRVN